LALDEHTKNRMFGQYARTLVDMDLSERIFNNILVERDDFAFYVAVSYEKQPLFCPNCKRIGHSIHFCKKIGYKIQGESKEVKKHHIMHDNVVNLHKKLHQPDKPIEVLVNS